jgi:hypothetical protein
MDNYQNFLAYWHIRNHIHIIDGFKECTDLILEVLVIEKILTQEERYLVFSTPSPTVYCNAVRWHTLLEILRNKKGLICFLAFLKKEWSWSSIECRNFLNTV